MVCDLFMVSITTSVFMMSLDLRLVDVGLMAVCIEDTIFNVIVPTILIYKMKLSKGLIKIGSVL